MRVFDFFSGCGGTSSGFAAAGLNIAFALDIDKDATDTFRTNFPKATVLNKDIRKADTKILEPLLADRGDQILFCGCAPCQPFSKQNGRKRHDDPRSDLLSYFGTFVERWMPDYVFVENVPGLQRLPSTESPLSRFTELLDACEYKYEIGVLPALWFGVPQTRERLVLLASKTHSISLPSATYGPETNQKKYSSVRDWIGDLPPLKAGHTSKSDPDHQASLLSSINLLRIAATPEGGGRNSWPKQLWLDCHKNHTGHSDVYGRLAWDQPASGLTTRCISYSNGRFGHPAQNRALSIREAACLQTFPRTYRFSGSLTSRARQIGNAVPPLMAKSIGAAVQKHVKKHLACNRG
jgi:DNA (cytosine-5)-methyltransferase 1